MSNQENPGSGLFTLLREMQKYGLPLLVTFLFSTALIGGGSYLLFDRRTEENRLEKEITQFEIDLEEENAFDAITNIVDNGWEHSPSIQKTDYIFTTIMGAMLQDSLSEEFETQSDIWINRGIHALVSERGQMKGLIVHDETLREYQNGLIKDYDSLIETFQLMRDLVKNWNAATPETKLQKRNAVSESTLKIIESKSLHISLLKQMISKIEIKQEKNRQRVNELQTELDALSTRSVLATLGIVLGGILVSASLLPFGLLWLRERNKNEAPSHITAQSKKKKSNSTRDK